MKRKGSDISPSIKMRKIQEEVRQRTSLNNEALVRFEEKLGDRNLFTKDGWELYTPSKKDSKRVMAHGTHYRVFTVATLSYTMNETSRTIKLLLLFGHRLFVRLYSKDKKNRSVTNYDVEDEISSIECPNAAKFAEWASGCRATENLLNKFGRNQIVYMLLHLASYSKKHENFDLRSHWFFSKYIFEKNRERYNSGDLIIWK